MGVCGIQGEGAEGSLSTSYSSVGYLDAGGGGAGVVSSPDAVFSMEGEAVRAHVLNSPGPDLTSADLHLFTKEPLAG